MWRQSRYEKFMTEDNSRRMKNGTKLVIGLIILAAVLVIFSRLYRTPPAENWYGSGVGNDFPAMRKGIDLSQEGKKLLPPEERREMDAIYAEALQALEPAERQRFITIAQKGSAANESEMAESAALIQRAISGLPSEKSTRLWALVDKAVRLAREKSSATSSATN